MKTISTLDYNYIYNTHTNGLTANNVPEVHIETGHVEVDHEYVTHMEETG
jgi:hypothetical protein